MKILDALAMREVDRKAIEEIGVPSLVLMENAAIGLADAIGEVYPGAESAAIFCGPGNNGGDGLALARHLTARGYAVEIMVITGGKGLQGDAAIQLQICRNADLSVTDDSTEDAVHRAIEIGGRSDLVVDALFGTGLTRPLEGRFAHLVEAINTIAVPCVAVDLPSGLNGSSHEIMGPHVQADLTVTFAAPKIAHALLPAAAAVGEVVVADLGIPPSLIDGAAGELHLLTEEALASRLTPRATVSHKGDFGHTVVLAGSVGKAGAAILAARAAVRTGAGLVTVAAPRSIVETVDLGSVESMTLPLPLDEGGGLAPAGVDEILRFLRDKDAIAIGPGLGTEVSTVASIRALVAAIDIPFVLDADGINAFEGAADLLSEARCERVLTPHPGELGRLLGRSAAAVQANRVDCAREAAAQTGAVVLLKGAQSLVAEPSGQVWINPTGNPGMASGGTGDVLTGIVAGLLGQGFDTVTAACLGAWVHGAAGDRARQARGEMSLAAGDLIEELPGIFLELEA